MYVHISDVNVVVVMRTQTHTTYHMPVDIILCCKIITKQKRKCGFVQ